MTGQNYGWTVSLVGKGYPGAKDISLIKATLGLLS